MIKKIDWFIVKSYIIPFIITFFIAEFVLVSQVIFVYLDDLIGKGVKVTIILELLFLIAAQVVPMALPLSVLLSSIMAMGNIGERSELTAMKSAGLSIFRVMRPLIVVMLFISVGSFFFSNYIWGKADFRQKMLMGDIRNTKLSLVLKPGVFFNEIDNFSIRANEVNKETNELFDVLIYEYNPTYNFRKIVRAEKGTMGKSDDGKNILITLFNGQITEVMNPGKNPFEEKSKLPHQQISFIETTQKIDVSSLGLVRTDGDNYQEMFQFKPINELENIIDSLQKNHDTIKRNIKHYYNNTHLITKLKGQYDYDTIKTSTYNFDSLSTYEQKTVVNNTKNRLTNSINYLQNQEQSFNAQLKKISILKIEWHRKLTLSLACIILFFLGAPLGAIVKKGGFGIPIAIAIIMFLIYYIISITGERLAVSLVIVPLVGMWLSSVILFPLGILFTYQAVTESKIMDVEAWRNFFKRIVKKAISPFKRRKTV